MTSSSTAVREVIASASALGATRNLGDSARPRLMSTADEFDQVRSDPDPIRRGQRATELPTRYRPLAVELADVRRQAIEEAHRAGLSYTAIAERIGVTTGRISQIVARRSTAGLREE